MAVGKVALHLLAPAFFPLWDDKIAKGYGCYYLTDPMWGMYLVFLRDFQRILRDSLEVKSVQVELLC